MRKVLGPGTGEANTDYTKFLLQMAYKLAGEISPLIILINDG